MTDPKKPSEPKIPASAGAAETSFFADVVKWARSSTSAEVDRGITSTISESVKLITSVATLDVTKPGDQRTSQKWAAGMEEYFAKTSQPKDFGGYDLMMASGWQPKGPIKVNGEMRTLDKPVDNMLAVFIKNKDGSVELLDPSVKVTSLGDTPILLNALMPPGPRRNEVMMSGLDDKYKEMLRKETPTDARWRETAGTFVLTQIAPMIAGGALTTLGKGAAVSAAKIPQLEKAIDTGTKIASRTAGVVGGLNGATAVVGVGGQLGQGLYFTPAAIKKIGDTVSASLNSSEISADTVRKNLNESLSELSFKEGSDAKQNYIPSLPKDAQPWSRLQATLQGVFTAHNKPNHPWEKWSEAKPVVSEEVRDALKQNNGVNYAFYSSVEKHLTGKPLTDRDIFVMRTGINLGSDLAGISLVGKDPKNPISYTPEERAETVKRLDDVLKERLVTKLGNDESVAKKLGIDINQVNPFKPEFTPAQLKAFVSDSVVESRTAYNAEKKRDEPIPHTSLGMWR